MNKHLYNLVIKGIYSYRKLFKKRENEKILASEFFCNNEYDLGNRTKEWDIFQKKFLQFIKNEDLNNFLQWQVINDTMFFNAPYIEFLSLKNSKNWTLWKKGIKESSVGNPKPYIHYLHTSGNLVHHAYSMLQLIDLVPISTALKAERIIEFGGGYGSLCRLIYNLGFNGKYEIIDFDVFNHLQKFYLKQVLDRQNFGKINFQTEFNKLNFEGSLFIGLWSLSESPIEVRNKIIPFILKSDLILIAYQHDFSNIDNQKYFEENLVISNDYIWRNYPIEHLPNNHYLIGIKS